jgi:hypothetical protein
VQRRISYYDVDWDRKKGSGGIWLTFDDRTRAELAPLQMDEVTLLCSILRIGKTVYYDAESDRLSTQADPVGDAR